MSGRRNTTSFYFFMIRSKSFYDVAVVGGGPSGIGAALGAARCGASVVLLERSATAGGMGSLALVNNFCNAHFDGERMIIGGVFHDLRQRLIARGALHVTGGLEPYHHDVMAEEAEAMLRKAGVTLRYKSALCGAKFSPGEVTLMDQDGGNIHAKSVVDATGDAHLATLAGVPFTQRKSVMPLTYCYLIGPVDLERLNRIHPDAFAHDIRTGAPYISLGGQEWLIEAVGTARACGELTIPRKRIAVAYSLPGAPEVVSVNFGRVNISDPTQPDQLEQASREGVRQVHEGIAFFRKYVPGFESAGLLQLAERIGVRESRQIDGLYRLTEDDVLACRQFPDVIAQCRYSIDVHLPDSDGTRLVTLPAGRHYDIPLRCLIPKEGPENLIVAGRCISADQSAMSSFRVAPSVMAIGEAAGVTAALARGRAMAAVPYSEAREALLAGGGILS